MKREDILTWDQYIRQHKYTIHSQDYSFHYYIGIFQYNCDRNILQGIFHRNMYQSIQGRKYKYRQSDHRKLHFDRNIYVHSALRNGYYHKLNRNSSVIIRILNTFFLHKNCWRLCWKNPQSRSLHQSVFLTYFQYLHK